MATTSNNEANTNFELIDFNLKGTDDKNYTLSDFAQSKIIIIVFMCNHCPYVKAVTGRLSKLQSEYKGQGVQFIGINSNDTEAYPEDSFENMKLFAKEKNLNFPYLIDTSQDTARKYGAICTPDLFLFGSDKKLKYRGRIDDNWKEEDKVTREDLRMAIEQVLSYNEIKFNVIPSIGCSLKWRK